MYCLRKTGVNDGFEKGGDLSCEQVVPDGETGEMIREIGRVFGMSVYGVDYYIEGDKKVIFDVNDFPSYGGIPGGADGICRFVCEEYLSD